MEKKCGKFYLIANKKTGKFYKENACIKHGEYAIKLTSTTLEEATKHKTLDDAIKVMNFVEDKTALKLWREGTITVADIQYEVNYPM
jgi:hypothetical protein